MVNYVGHTIYKETNTKNIGDNIVHAHFFELAPTVVVTKLKKV